MAAIAEHMFEAAQIFEIDVANRQDFMFHRRLSRDGVVTSRASRRGATGTV
jgi:hypothetical protein